MLTTQMKSVGEVMAIGRTFKESLPEGAARAGGRPVRPGLRQEGPLGHRARSRPRTRSRRSWPRRTPSASGTSATRSSPGCRVEEIHALTGIDPWFLANLDELVELEGPAPRRSRSLEEAGDALIREAKRNGFSDRQLATSGARPRPRSAATASGGGSRPSSSWSTPAPPSSRRSRPITTRPTRTRTRPASATSRGS